MGKCWFAEAASRCFCCRAQVPAVNHGRCDCDTHIPLLLPRDSEGCASDPDESLLTESRTSGRFRSRWRGGWYPSVLTDKCLWPGGRPNPATEEAQELQLVHGAGLLQTCRPCSG